MYRTRKLRRADWPVLDRLMGSHGGERGVGGGCWCQWARVPHGGKQWEACQGEANRRAFRAEIENGQAHGSLAFHKEECVGWCRYGPVTDFPRLANSPSLNTWPPAGTWSVVCFYIPPTWRGKGVASVLLDHAIAVMARRRVPLVEAYPVPRHGFAGKKVPAGFAWTGVPEMFRAVGFEPVRRRSETRRRVYRLDLAAMRAAIPQAGPPGPENGPVSLG